MNFSNHLNSWANLYCKYIRKEILDIFICMKAWMKGLQGQPVEKRKSTFGRGETTLEICHQLVFPWSMSNFCGIWSEIKAVFATLLSGSFSPVSVALAAPAGRCGLLGSGTLSCPRGPGSPGLLKLHHGHWAPRGSQQGPGAVASPVHSLTIWRTGWKFCGSVSQRGFRK